jgi:flagellar basal-body rod modification protein FlgD
MNGDTVIIALANGDEVESSSITKVSEAGENDSSDQEG